MVSPVSLRLLQAAALLSQSATGEALTAGLMLADGVGVTVSQTAGNVFLKHGQDNHMDIIQNFAVSISAKTAAAPNQESEVRGLVQHTPKRNKESESIPSKHHVIPATQQIHHHSGPMSLGAGMYTGSHTQSPFYPSYSDPPTQTAPPS